MARRADPGFGVIVKLNDKFTGPIKGVNQKIAQTSAQMKQMGAQSAGFMRNLNFQNIGQSFGKLGTAVGGLGRSIGGLLGPLTKVGAILGTVATGAFIKDTVQAGADLVKVSQQTRVGVEALQELRYAAEQVGLPVEQMDNALMRLNRTMQAAMKDKKGTGGAAQVMKAIGVSMADVQKGAISTEEVYRRLTRAVSNSTNESYKQWLVEQALSRSGAAMLPILEEGIEYLNQMADEKRAAGIISDEQARSFKALGDQTKTLTEHIKGLGIEVTAQLAPVLGDVVTKMGKWMEANKEWLKVEIVAAVRSIIDAGRQLYRIITNYIVPAVKSMKPAWEGFESIVGPTNAKLIAFAAIMSPSLVANIANVGGALLGVGKALTGLSMTPLLVLGAVAGIVAYGIYKEWDTIKKMFAEDMPQAFKQTGERLKQGLSEVPEQVATWPQEFGKMLAELPKFGSDLMAGFRRVGTNLSEAGSEIWGGITTAARDIWNDLPNSVPKLMGDIGNAFRNGAAALRSAMVTVFTDPIQAIKDAWNAFWGWIEGLYNKIIGLFSKAKQEERAARELAEGKGGVSANVERMIEQQAQTQDVGGAWAAQIAQKQADEAAAELEDLRKRAQSVSGTVEPVAADMRKPAQPVGGAVEPVAQPAVTPQAQKGGSGGFSLGNMMNWLTGAKQEPAKSEITLTVQAAEGTTVRQVSERGDADVRVNTGGYTGAHAHAGAV